MTLFHFEGFETLGNSSTTGANLETRIIAVPQQTFTELNGGHSTDVALISDFETVGLALRFPVGITARGTLITLEWPSAYKVTTNSSHPTMVTGFRYYNADSNPEAVRTIWQHLIGASSSQGSLKTSADNLDLIWDDDTGAHTISSVLTADTWHYIEIEFKATTSANGGFVKIYVDDSEVYHGATRNIVSAAFYTSYGVRFGLVATANETGGNQPAFDDLYQLHLDGTAHTARLGPCRVLLLKPDADATPNNWAPSTGATNFNIVNKIDWATGTYVEADVTGDDDHYSMDTLPAVTTVHALQVDALVEAVDGTPNLHLGFDDGTADETDVGTIATGSTTVGRSIHTDDPSGTAWTQSTVNSADLTQRMTE